MKKYIIRITGVVLALALIGVCIYMFMNSRFTFNDEHADGNTPANLLNNGLLREYDGKIYFSNLKDDGKLYVMDNDFTNFKKLSNDRINNINVSGKYIIYSRINNQKKNATKSAIENSAVGIYLTDLKGKSTTELDSAVEGMVHQYGNMIYYQTYNKKTAYKFNKMDIQGKKKELVMNDPIYPASIVNDTLYYTGSSDDHNIHTMNLSTMESNVLVKGNYFHLAANNGYLYMINIKDNYSIYRMDLNGKNPEKLVSSRTCTYNITPDNNYLYYQVDDNKNNGIYRLNIKTKRNELLISGNFNNINLTENYVFFTDMNETQMYAVPIGDAQTVSAFNPVVCK